MSHPGYPTPSQYTTNVGYDEPSSQVSVSYVHLSPSIIPSLITASSKSQTPYAYQDNQIIVHQGAGATENTYDSSIAPGLRQPEYYTPPDHVRACSLFVQSPSDWVRSHRRYQMVSLSAVHINRPT
jgi:hypothetical protein